MFVVEAVLRVLAASSLFLLTLSLAWWIAWRLILRHLQLVQEIFRRAGHTPQLRPAPPTIPPPALSLPPSAGPLLLPTVPLPTLSLPPSAGPLLPPTVPLPPPPVLHDGDGCANASVRSATGSPCDPVTASRVSRITASRASRITASKASRFGHSCPRPRLQAAVSARRDTPCQVADLLDHWF